MNTLSGILGKSKHGIGSASSVGWQLGALDIAQKLEAVRRVAHQLHSDLLELLIGQRIADVKL